MPDQSVTLPPAGWYPDPDGSGQSRWWNGQSWTEHFVPLVTADTVASPPTNSMSDLESSGPQAGPIPTPPVQGALAPVAEKVTLNGRGYNPYNPGRDLAARKNTLATNGLVFGILSLLLNPFLLIGIGAILWGSFGLARANRWEREGNAPIGRKRAIWGVVLGAVGTLFTMSLKAFMF